MAVESDPTNVIACNLNAFDEAQRRRYEVVKAEIRSVVRSVRELVDGFAIELPGDHDILAAAGEWIALERRCCPFFAFVLDVPGGAGPIELRITGPGPAKEILRDGLRFAPDVPAARLRSRR